MKPAAILGIILIVVGIVALVYPAFHYTKREEVLKLGPIEATAETRHAVPIPPAASWACVVIGAGLLAFGVAKRP